MKKNRFLGLRNVPDCILDYILSRDDQHQAIKLYNISKDYIFYNKINSTVEVKDQAQYIFDKNKSDNSGLTIKEKSITTYIVWSFLSAVLMYYFSSKYNSNIGNYYNDFILTLCFSIIFLFVGASHVVKYQRLKCAKEFVDLD